ncbi:MAG: response regulator [Oceanospirillaceae bacterium]|nr:response regulator [Oceanospirillaceae bacterium]
MHGKSQYSLNLIGTLESELAAEGFELNIFRLRDNETSTDLESFEAHLAQVQPSGIILARVLQHEPVFVLLRRRAIPFVIFGHNADSGSERWTDIDNRAAFWLTTRKCIDLGHQRIALLNGPAEYSYAEFRAEGYKTALLQAGLKVDDDLILNGEPTFAMGSVMAGYLLQQDPPPSALVCGTDEMAMGAMYSCLDLGLKPGIDISVVGYGNSEAGANSRPRLATVEFDLQLVGRLLAKQLLAQLTGTHSKRVDMHQLLPVSWVNGDSLSPPRRHESREHEGHKPSSDLAQKNAALNRAQQVVHVGNWQFNPLSNQFIGSAEFCAILGATRASHLSLSDVAALIIDDDRSVFETAWKRAIEGRPFDTEVRFQVKGVERALHWRGEFVRNCGDLAYAEGAVQDVSEAAAVRKELQIARDEAFRANRAKDLFLANMSHEIRTPIHAILGLTDILLRQTAVGPGKSTIQKIGKSGKNLLNIINDILLISKVESNALEIEDFTFDLQAVVDDLAAAMEGLLANKSLKFTLPTIDRTWRYLRGDPTRLSQVLLNLLANATKFTAKGEIELSIEALAADRIGNQVQLRFSVTDTGVGIPADKLSVLFEPFSQADASTSRKYGGTGLGLTIVDSLLRLMGSEVEVVSTPGVGSSFSFVLRLEKSQVEESHFKDEDRLRVLIVDDSATARLDAANVVLELGWSATTVESAAEALNELLRSPEGYDLLLMDFYMPGMNGLELAQQIRQSASSDLRILVLSSHNREELDSALSHFVNGFLRKPLNSRSLLENLAGEMDTSEPSNARTGASLAGLRVLCVDDSEINLDLLVGMLADVGAEVVTASSAESALALLGNAESFDLVLSDIQMPEMDGFELTQQIHRLQNGSEPPVIGVSAGMSDITAPKARAAGMEGYLEKPFNIDQLVDAVERVLRKESKVTESSSTINEPSNSEGALFNLRFALDRWSNRGNFINQLYSFLRQYADDSFILKLIDNKELEVAMQQTHKLKGVAAVLGLERLAESARALEMELREGSPQHSVSTIKELAVELSDLQKSSLGAIQVWLSEQSPAAESKPDDKPSISMAELLEAILECDPVRVEELMQRQIDGASPELLSQITASVAQFDFPAAAASLRIALAGADPDTVKTQI